MDDPQFEKILVTSVPVSKSSLELLSSHWYGDFLKGVVDIEQKRVAFGGEYHRDGLTQLIESGSNETDVWGFNVLLSEPRESWLEFDSLINIRPALGNRTRTIESRDIQDKVAHLVQSFIV